jgi:hypothetical protein
MRSPLILIGPMHAGKSTIARLLAERWGVRRICMDHVRWDYYREIGYDEARQKEAYERGGAFGGMVAYWKPFEAHAVERLLADVTSAGAGATERCVIDFGAGHSVYEDPALFARVHKALMPHPVVLLLPSPDPEESIVILRARREALHPQRIGKPPDDVDDVNKHFVHHPSNGRLAKFTVYTRDRTPEQTVEEIASLIGHAPPVAGEGQQVTSVSSWRLVDCGPDVERIENLSVVRVDSEHTLRAALDALRIGRPVIAYLHAPSDDFLMIGIGGEFASVAWGAAKRPIPLRRAYPPRVTAHAPLECMYGGQDTYISPEELMPAAEAIAVILEYFKTSQLSSSVTWTALA